MNKENLTNEENQDSLPDAPAAEKDTPETPAVSLESPEDTETAGQTAGMVAEPDPVPQDISGSLAAVFVLSMIFGIMVFDMLSKRWHT